MYIIGSVVVVMGFLLVNWKRAQEIKSAQEEEDHEGREEGRDDGSGLGLSGTEEREGDHGGR